MEKLNQNSKENFIQNNAPDALSKKYAPFIKNAVNKFLFKDVSTLTIIDAFYSDSGDSDFFVILEGPYNSKYGVAIKIDDYGNLYDYTASPLKSF